MRSHYKSQKVPNYCLIVCLYNRLFLSRPHQTESSDRSHLLPTASQIVFSWTGSKLDWLNSITHHQFVFTFSALISRLSLAKQTRGEWASCASCASQGLSESAEYQRPPAPGPDHEPGGEEGPGDQHPQHHQPGRPGDEPHLQIQIRSAAVNCNCWGFVCTLHRFSDSLQHRNYLCLEVNGFVLLVTSRDSSTSQ